MYTRLILLELRLRQVISLYKKIGGGGDSSQVFLCVKLKIVIELSKFYSLYIYRVWDAICATNSE